MSDEKSELSYEAFARARKHYWQPETTRANGDAVRPNPNGTSLARDGSDFMLYSAGPRGLFAVFEDFDRKGWFYLYDSEKQRVVKSAYIYNRENVAVEEDVIDIGWAADDTCCGLAVWGEFRAFLGISNDVHLERPVTSEEEQGIPSGKWPPGFELYLEKNLD
jgi:hypothetical protein